MGSSDLFSSTSIKGGWMNGVGVRADPSAPMSLDLDVTVTDVPFPGVTPPAGVAGQDAADADVAPDRENHGLLLCRSSLPEEVAAGAAAAVPACCCSESVGPEGFEVRPVVRPCVGFGWGRRDGRSIVTRTRCTIQRLDNFEVQQYDNVLEGKRERSNVSIKYRTGGEASSYGKMRVIETILIQATFPSSSSSGMIYFYFGFFQLSLSLDSLDVVLWSTRTSRHLAKLRRVSNPNPNPNTIQ